LQLAYDGGEFSKIVPVNTKCRRLLGFAGLEDLQVGEGDRVFIASDSRPFVRLHPSLNAQAARSKSIANSPQGHILTLQLPYSSLSNLQPTLFIGYPQQDFHPHGISVAKVGKRELVAVVNHQRNMDSVDMFAVLDDSENEEYGSVRLEFQFSATHPLFRDLNDVLIVDAHSFYVTIWNYYPTGTFENLLELFSYRSWTYVLYCNKSLSGKEFECRKVVEGLQMANSLAFSPDRNTVYLTTTISKTLSVFDREPDNSLRLRKQINLGFGIDNVNVDKNNGIVYVAGHPKVLTFKFLHSEDLSIPSPSKVVAVNVTTGTVSTAFASNGEDISGSSGVDIFNSNLILIGGVFSDGLLLCPITTKPS